MEGARYQQMTSIKETGVVTTIKWPYVNRVFYVQHCLWNTTLGPSILYSLTFSSMVNFCKRIHPILMYYSRVVSFLMITAFVIEILLVTNNVSLDTTLKVQLALAACAVVAYFGEFLVFLFVDIPTRLAWGVSLVFKTESNLSTTNTFVEISKNEKLDYVATDLEHYALAASLQTVQKIKLMIYTSKWEKKYLIWNTFLLPTINVLFFIVILFGTYLRTSIIDSCNTKSDTCSSFECNFDIDIPFYGESSLQCNDFGSQNTLNEWRDKCVSCNAANVFLAVPLANVGFAVAQMIALLLAYYLLRVVIAIVYFIINVIFCFIPGMLIKRWNSAMISHASRDIAENRSATCLDYAH